MSYEAHLRFISLTDRQKAVDPGGHALNPEILNNAIRQAFVDVFIRERRPLERKFIDRMLNRATRAAAAGHEEITHYVPCVVVNRPSPAEFEVGPVRFLTSQSFLAEHSVRIEQDERERRQKAIDLAMSAKRPPVGPTSDTERVRRQFLEGAFDYYRAFTWVAEVKVPKCDPEISRRRAVRAAQGALDVLKLFFGPYRGQGPELRLGHDPAPNTRRAEVSRHADGFHLTNIFGGEGAFAEEEWYDELKKSDPYRHLDIAGAALGGYLNPGVMSAHRDRWLDALHWYGEAVSERGQAAQLVKFVAALERLTVTDETGTDDVTEVVTGRTALLASHYTTERKNLVEDAREIYRWRSDLMHGRTSPLAEGIGEVLQIAYEIVRLALFGALILFYTLQSARNIRSGHLEQWFRTAAIPPAGPGHDADD